ncbi:MAG: hypothetical protein GX597_17405 [Anaerolineaceae bacterium]|nr:hypothetical protein [Anaerolineaceae bacterium]
MRHAEAIGERIVALGGEPTSQPATITLGKTTREMLGNDREQERQAIDLYGEIIEAARRVRDDETMRLFQRILIDEQAHHRMSRSYWPRADPRPQAFTSSRPQQVGCAGPSRDPQGHRPASLVPGTGAGD